MTNQECFFDSVGLYIDAAIVTKEEANITFRPVRRLNGDLESKIEFYLTKEGLLQIKLSTRATLLMNYDYRSYS